MTYCGGLDRQARNPARLPDGSGGLASAGGSVRDDIIDTAGRLGRPAVDGEDER